MNRPWTKLIFFLVPAVAGTIYLLWRLSPEQAIIRRADAIFASVEKRPLSTGTVHDKAERFRQMLSPQLEISAPRPVPSGEISPDAAADNLVRFLHGVATCRVTRQKETVVFPSEDTAIYKASIEVDVTVGRSSSRILRYECRLEFEKVDQDWLLRLVILTAI